MTCLLLFPHVFLFSVCRALIDEVEAEIDKVSPAKKVNVGSFRLDGDGNVKQVLVIFLAAILAIFLTVIFSCRCTIIGKRHSYSKQ